MSRSTEVVRRAEEGLRPSHKESLTLAEDDDLPRLMQAAQEMTLRGFGLRVAYSRKVFIPLTHLCRDVCHYCTFAKPHRKGSGKKAYMTLDEVLQVAQKGAAVGCKEALFTLGDKPELRYESAREELGQLGCNTTLEYVEQAARLVFERTGLLPHLNPGLMNAAELERLRRVSVSMGVMLESTAERLCTKGMPHWRSPDKLPQRRLATLREAGKLSVPFTTGLLIGIGETRRERIETLLHIRDLHDEFGHIQEVIIQGFRAKSGTRMEHHSEPDTEDLLWTVAVARLLLGDRMSIQSPPNLSPEALTALVQAGVNDWGGVSPVTPDYVNPEAPWPEIEALEAQTAAAGRSLVERLAITPPFTLEPERWVDPGLRVTVSRLTDSCGYARQDDWHAGAGTAPPQRYARQILHDHPLYATRQSRDGSPLQRILDRVLREHAPSEDEIAALFGAEGDDFSAVVRAADDLRARVVGDTVTYVVNRNINYTNVCRYTCGFCAFSKGRSSRSLRGPGYLLDLEEVGRRASEAWQRGATEVCLQGGIHPHFTGQTYLDIVAAVKAAVPAIHVHAFSPLEVLHGARTLGVSVESFLSQLAGLGLGTLPGTAAEILDDEVRAIICPDKLSTSEWLDVIGTAHRVGLKTTATIMFGHVETPRHWARHLLRIRALQEETGGITEFVPLPFVHMESPLWRRGRARSGPTFREAILMHSIARLALHPLIRNIQASWVKMGPVGAQMSLAAGANDLGGTLMNESITRAAGGVNGQEQDEEALRSLIRSAGRSPLQRTTLYGEPFCPVPASTARQRSATRI